MQHLNMILGMTLILSKIDILEGKTVSKYKLFND